MGEEYHLSTNPIPDGFRIFLNNVPVAGLAMRKRDASKFCRSPDRSLLLEREPGNKHDPNAIKVMGSWKGWLGRKVGHLGYVPAEHAAKLMSVGLADTITARLLKTYIGADGYVDIEFQIIGPTGLYETFAPRLPTRPVTAESVDAAVQKIDALINFLEQAPKLSARDAQSLYKASFAKTFDAMVGEGKTYGEALGGPDFLNKPESEFRAHLRSIDNDLEAQADIVDTACRAYFKMGETPAPYYPWRIAVILSKLKQKDRERDFLAAWCRHFPGGNGGRYADLVSRAEKLGVRVKG